MGTLSETVKASKGKRERVDGLRDEKDVNISIQYSMNHMEKLIGDLKDERLDDDDKRYIKSRIQQRVVALINTLAEVPDAPVVTVEAEAPAEGAAEKSKRQ